MDFALLLFCSFVLGLGLTFLAAIGVGWIRLWCAKPKSVRKSRRKNKFSKGFCLFLIAITLTSCSRHICVPIEVPSCPPMLREATYRAMQADERRDYRIAIESCRAK